MDSKAIKPKEKKEAEASGEFTQNGPVFVPSVDIYENKEALTLVADMPGVSSDGVEIHLKDNDLNILGRTKNEEVLGSPVYTEYESGDYLRRFTLSSMTHFAALVKYSYKTLRCPCREGIMNRKGQTANRWKMSAIFPVRSWLSI